MVPCTMGVTIGEEIDLDSFSYLYVLINGAEVHFCYDKHKTAIVSLTRLKKVRDCEHMTFFGIPSKFLLNFYYSFKFLHLF